MAELLFETYGVPSIGTNTLQPTEKLHIYKWPSIENWFLCKIIIYSVFVTWLLVVFPIRDTCLDFVLDTVYVILLVEVIYASLFWQPLVLMRHSAINIINNKEFVLKMVLLCVLDSTQLMWFRYAFYVIYWIKGCQPNEFVIYVAHYCDVILQKYNLIVYYHYHCNYCNYSS